MQLGPENTLNPRFARSVAFSVLMNDGEQELVFYKSPVSGRWWMEVPVQARPDGRSAMEVLVPCSQEDYTRACADEIPERWWGAYRKGL